MADHTIPGIIGIVAIVLVVAVFLGGAASTQPAASSSSDTTQTLAGSAYTSAQAQPADTCEPKTFCDGTKLTFVREDCSMNYAYCQHGCSDARCI